MDVRNCKKCGKLFQYVGSPICPACNKEMDDKFLDVKNYIYDNPQSTMSKVSEETDIPIQQIKKWVREERLSFSKDSGITIDCEKCGKPILTGRFCKECKSHMSDSLSKMFVTEGPAAKQAHKESGGKMRFLGK